MMVRMKTSDWWGSYWCQMPPWRPGCPWPPRRSCRCPPPRCPASPPPQCTAGRCKAPWSARAWAGTQQGGGNIKTVSSELAHSICYIKGEYGFKWSNETVWPKRVTHGWGVLLCHYADFDSKDPALLLGGSPLQAQVPTGELHGELHFDLWETRWGREGERERERERESHTQALLQRLHTGIFFCSFLLIAWQFPRGKVGWGGGVI